MCVDDSIVSTVCALVKLLMVVLSTVEAPTELLPLRRIDNDGPIMKFLGNL